MEYTLIAFVDKLLEEKGVSGLPTEVMDQLRNDLITRAENIINAEIFAHMPKEALEEFEKILDTEDEDTIRIFCSKHIPNMDEVVAGALMKLKNIYLQNSLA